MRASFGRVSFKLISLVAILIFVMGCTPGRTVKLMNPIKTCRTVKTPYQATEEYSVPLKFEVTRSIKTTTLKGFDVWARGEVTVRNVDSETGTFRVDQSFTTLNGGKRTYASSGYIMPGESRMFIEESDISVGEDFNMNYQVSPPSKTKTRTVTKYREEQVCN